MTNNKIEVSFKLEDIPMIIETLEKIQNENKQLKEKIDILLEDNNQLEEIRIKAIEYIKEHTDKLKTTRVPKIDFNYNEVLETLGDKE